jgi:hypothetical protein
MGLDRLSFKRMVHSVNPRYAIAFARRAALAFARASQKKCPGAEGRRPGLSGALAGFCARATNQTAQTNCPFRGRLPFAMDV